MHRWLRLGTATAICGLALIATAPLRAATPTPPTPSTLAGWPMDGHDPQRTSRSPGVGPLQPRLLFHRKGVTVSYVAPDGTMDGILVRKRMQYREAGFSASGRVSWSHPARVEGQLVGIGPNGTIFQVDNMQASAYTPSGRLLWKTHTLGLLKGTSPLVTSTNRLYAPVVGPPGYSTRIGINIVSGTGRLLGLIPGDWLSPALSPGGSMYLLVQGSTTLQAVSETGIALWRFDLGGTPDVLLDPLVGKDGTVYVGNGTHLLAVTPDGHARWSVGKSDGVLALAERADGSLLAAGADALDAFDADGNHLWSVPIGRSSTQYRAYRPSLVVDSAGTAYVGSGDGIVRLISAGGKLLAEVKAGALRSDDPPHVLLGADGRLIVNGTDGVLRVYGPAIPTTRTRQS
jgi:outer membrane protein assembly factor BamB